MIILALVLAQSAVPTPPIDAHTDWSPNAVVQEALERIAASAGEERALMLDSTERPSRDGSIEDGRLHLSAATLASARSPQELVALPVLALAAGLASDGGDHARKPTTREYLGLLAFAATAKIVDPIDQRVPEDVDRRRYDLPGRVDRDRRPSGTPAGRTAIVLLAEVGSCTGAALAIADRIRRGAPGTVGATSDLISAAERARSDFGILAFPPDQSCVGR